MHILAQGGPSLMLGAALIALTPSASAQSFGDLTGAIKRTVSRSTGGDSGSRPSQPRNGPSTSGQSSTAASAATAGPEPWPTNVGSRSIATPYDFQFSPELEAGPKALREFSKVRCNNCEGGYSFDAWANLILGLKLQDWHNKIGESTVGTTLSWRGDESDGKVTVVGDAQVGPYPCKQVRYTLVRRSDKSSAERPGLFCFGKASSFAGSPSWVEAL